MRVSIFGATGGIGRWLLAIARENGDNVKILVRDRRKLPRDLGAIGVIEGDVRDPGAVEATVGGTDVVFSAIGPDGLGPTTLLSQGMQNVIAAMHKAGTTRLLAVSSAGVDDDPNMNFFSRRIFLPLLLRNVLADLRVMEREIESSGLVYTVVRPGRLTDGPRSGLYRANDRLVPGKGSRNFARRRGGFHAPRRRRRTNAAQSRGAYVLTGASQREHDVAHRADDQRIELRPASAVQFVEGGGRRHWRAIRPAADHGVEAVRDRDDPDLERNVLTAEPIRVPPSVEPFVVRPRD